MLGEKAIHELTRNNTNEVPRQILSFDTVSEACGVCGTGNLAVNSELFAHSLPPAGSDLLNSRSMQRAIAADLPGKASWFSRARSRVRLEAPTLYEWGGALASAILLILSFPNASLPILAWMALVPLLLVIVRRPSPFRAFVLGWCTGTIFFYVSCHWLTYSMIHYGGIAKPLAYLLLVPGALVIGLFPGFFTLALSLAIKRWGSAAVLIAPVFWTTCEWFRLGVTGQLWNALGYSQAEVFSGLFIQTAQFGGVYAVSFLLAMANALIVFVVFQRNRRSLSLVVVLIAGVVFLMFSVMNINKYAPSSDRPELYVVALQPNVPMTMVKTVEETKELLDRHLRMSTEALRLLPADGVPRLVVWPESPMNFTYASDKTFQSVVAGFTRENHSSLLFNSLEPAANNGAYNSALLVNEEGRLISQYDKIRLMPFGEYVPIPQWLGGSLISGLVGDFTRGDKYTLMSIGNHRIGVFICIESAYPYIAQTLAKEGADVLVNISNDGYLGPTAVMRQHLANAIFRSVENGKPLLRVTNSGLSAKVSADGSIDDITSGFQPAVRIWTVTRALTSQTFYTRHGDIFVELCAIVTVLIVVIAVVQTKRNSTLR